MSISAALILLITLATTSSAQTLKSAAGSRYFGAALAQPHLQNASDPNFAAVGAAQFSGATPENEMKWENIEPDNGSFNFAPADVVVDFAKSNDMTLRCHNLVWHSQLAPYVSALPLDQVQQAMLDHITAVVTHFKGDCFAWDVVNEPFNDDGTFRDSPFFDAMGSDFIAIALQQARSIDPDAHLYINDFNIEGGNAKSDALFTLVQNLTSQGLIDGIGFESHFILNEIPTDLQSNMQRFADLGVEVAITELDIRITEPASSDDLAAQATQYNQVVAACVAISQCVGITTWGITDLYSWVPGTFAGQGSALLFDDTYTAKPAFQSTISAL